MLRASLVTCPVVVVVTSYASVAQELREGTNSCVAEAAAVPAMSPTAMVGLVTALLFAGGLIRRRA